MVRLVADGASNREIARTLFYSEDAVARSLSRAMRILGARNRAHLVRLAIESGIVLAQIAPVVEAVLPGA